MKPICTYDSIRAALVQRLVSDDCSQAELARRLGLGFSADISRMVRCEPVSESAQRRIARALGILPPPRKLIRRVMSGAEAAAWDALPRAERLRRLTA